MSVAEPLSIKVVSFLFSQYHPTHTTSTYLFHAHAPKPQTLSSAMPAWSDIASGTFGSLCVISALPLIGIPFPTREWASYYADKSRWMSRLSKGYLAPGQAAYAAAALRIAVGFGCVYQPTRLTALLANGAVVCWGTLVAYRDSRPMSPQWTMLGAIGLCLVLEKL
ncbi:hypothetical protein F4803DRAFT_333567 [Xylaria telfairii]|nr:hypothetical protein F4803DRAFT_333567 [Xylaria telfairii]